MKRILILTAGFGEGHNAAARGLRDGLLQSAAGEVEVEVRDLFAEAYGVFNDWARKGYLSLINRAPGTWGKVYQWIDERNEFAPSLKPLFQVKSKLSDWLARFRPDVVVSVYPVYFYLLEEILGSSHPFPRVTIVTDSITVNSIWYRSASDYFLVPNDATAAVLRKANVAAEKIKVLGFPVTTKFAGMQDFRPPPAAGTKNRVLYMINSGKRSAAELVEGLAALPDVELTVTVGKDERLRQAMETIRSAAPNDFAIIGWSDQLPELMATSHLLISKAGGATVQEAIAARCPMIINQVVPGQEEGNAQLIVESGSGVIADTTESIIQAVRDTFANDGAQWHAWSGNIGKLSRPEASLTTAKFLLSL